MKQLIILISSILLISIGLFTCKTSQQITDSHKLDENRTVYWFYIKLKEIEVKNTGITGYEIQRFGSKPETGTAKEYDYFLWKYLSEGTKFAIGPFNDHEEAKQAFLFYDIQKNSQESDKLLNTDREVFWFVLHVNFRERSISMELERIPGAIASGSFLILRYS